jgi:hypothetical protein
VKRISSIALLVLALSAFATAARAEGSYAGFRGGVVNASFADDEFDHYPWARTGFTGGGFIGKDVSKMFGFRIDAMYTQKGAYGPEPFVELDYLESHTDPGVNWGITQIKLDYLEVSPLLVARFALGGRYSIRGFLGPTLGFWVSAEAEDVILADGKEYRLDVDLGEIVEHFEFGGTIGVEFNAQVGPYIGLLEARYGRGGRVFEGQTLLDADLNLDVSNKTMAVLAGLMIPF